MKNDKAYINGCKKQFIERYRDVDIFYSKQNGYECGFYITYHTLEDAKQLIDHKLSTNMRVSANHGLEFCA